MTITKGTPISAGSMVDPRPTDFSAAAVLLAGMATCVPLVIDFGNYGWIGGAMAGGFFGSLSFMSGIVSCLVERRFRLLALTTPLMALYIIGRDFLRDNMMWRAEQAGLLWGDYGLNGTSGVVAVSIPLAAVPILIVAILGRFRIRNTRPVFLAASGVPALAVMWDLYTYQDVEARALRAPYFVALAYWLVVCGIGFAWIAISEMRTRVRHHSPLFGGVAVVVGATTIALALAAGAGTLGRSTLDGYHIDVLSTHLDRAWVMGLYVAIGAVLFLAGIRLLATNTSAEPELGS